MSLSALRHTLVPRIPCNGHRLIHASSAAMARQVRRRKPEEDESLIVTLDDLDTPAGDDDVSSAGHIMLRQQRKILYYMRLIEHDMPKLVEYRKPFTPPSSSTPLIIRSISYGGEEHPADRKRVIVAPVSKLPLKGDDARKRFKLLAGVRWSPEPPKDGGVSSKESDTWGYFKLACEDFPVPAMNLNWASDTLSRLIEEANNAQNAILDIPYDDRHLEAKLRKAKKGGHAKGRGYSRPTLKDFPKEWLPDSPVSSLSSPTTQ
ncbi:hypothetical protein EUX98_g663 [Antrodiella citrinella]|uniref:Small ribosomal subunit protein mS35 mitochondrial conserved domain-containing protein n=1 Tax=Antrodiella citrinella TaxID=2447956 RepID=A0A4S4NBZ6_9APHY|nr:hypothetical protein EUX98_g663 [Antrodiella citrinella]